MRDISINFRTILILATILTVFRPDTLEKLLYTLAIAVFVIIVGEAIWESLK